ncbi:MULTISPECIES: UbiA family prenyltransferase [unclassified Streptomyces]|uniref:UbiA family prenyltransferase n=1 Tax=unclassified Streptomyces TaxID=2593676 RepID=UPI0022B73E37|nr:MULTISPECIES: UbiA family prenyltransferase [unclassified Streptomyces]MCZ7416011.1 UbiA family prenyltransferase [Streptomyces sp. WMMC897]MCZ7434182.1 UbiA family prenyltransferase [Streptomyces sp. WMMC1477]
MSAPDADTARIPRPSAGRAVLLMLRSCSIRFTAYYWVGFSVGLAVNDRLNVMWGLFGAVVWLAYCVGTESVNRIADREADVVNRPERTALIEEFGWSRLTTVAVGAWTLYALTGVAMVWAEPGFWLPVLLLANFAVAVGYSLGPAFKRHRVLSLLALTCPLFLPLLTGWAVHGGTDTLLSPVLPAVTVLVTFSLGLSGIKDITDVEGDKRLDYSSLWLLLIRFRRGAAVYTLIGTPFLLLALFTALDALPAAAWTIVPLVVLSALVVSAASRATVPADRAAAREVMHQYTFYFLALVLVVSDPAPATIAAVVTSAAYWAVASRSLHWSGGLSAEHMRRWIRLLGAPPIAKEPS